MRTRWIAVLTVVLVGVIYSLSWTADPPPAPSKTAPECVKVFKGIRPQEIALSPCERYLAVAGRQAGTDDCNSLLLVWDLQTSKEVFRHSQLNGALDTVAFSPNGKLLTAAGSGASKPAIVWQFPSGKEQTRLVEAANPDDAQNVTCLRFAPDGKVLAMATSVKDNWAVVLWDTTNYQKKAMLKGIEHVIWQCAFSPDGNWLAFGDSAGDAYLWKLPEGKHVKTWATGTPPSGLQALCFSPKSKLLATAGEGGQIRLMDLANLANLDKPSPVLKGQNNFIKCLLFDMEGHWLFSAGSELPPGKTFGPESTVQVWNVAENKLHAKFKAPAMSMALTRDGRTLYTAGLDDDGCVKVWSLPPSFYKTTAPKQGS
jgi:WD40 repeat protein